MPAAALVVLNYEGRDLLDVALPSMLAQDHPDFEVILVDDGSRDDSVAHVRERWPEVRVVALERNVGVTAAMNRGLAATDAAFVALLNNDVELDAGWLAATIAVLDGDPSCAAATGKMLRFDRRDVIDAAGDLYLASGAALNRGAGEPDDGRFDVPEEVFGGCAGATLYRGAALADVGPFDEALVAYLEDVDWSLRARLRGWTVRYTPDARCYHMGGATTGRRPGRFAMLQRRNHLVLVAKNWPRHQLLSFGWLVVAYQLVWLLASVRDRRGVEHVRAWAAFARALPAVLTKRRGIQSSLRIAPPELNRAMHLGLPSSRAAVLALELAPEVARRPRRV